MRTDPQPAPMLGFHSDYDLALDMRTDPQQNWMMLAIVLLIHDD